MRVKSLLIFLIGIVLERASSDLPPTCSSKIFCQGPVLHYMQTREILNSTDTFIRLKLKTNEDEILENFEKLLEENPDPSNATLLAFVEEYFETPTELDAFTPDDMTDNPAFLSNIADANFQDFATELIKLWPELGKKVNEDVAENEDLYSLIPVPNGFIIPGGRFLELYYWDSFWIIKGLIICEMVETAGGMVDNIISLVRKLGHMPNGSRKFYEARSQPPLLSAMAKLYFDATNDLGWLQENIGTLEEELEFWLRERTVKVRKGKKRYTVLQYRALTAGPRPESYLIDYNNSLYLPEDERQIFFNNVKSAAESGWDFSTRWFKPDSTDLLQIQTTHVVPVDLNAFFTGALQIIGDFHNSLGNEDQASYYWNEAGKWRQTINDVFWDEDEGAWFDYDLQTKEHRKYFYPSNVSPLWAGAVEDTHIEQYGPNILNYLKSSRALDFPGGVPTSFVNSGQQWDCPNAWPPLQSIVVQALEALKIDEATQLAVRLAELWVSANLIGFTETGQMFEKYDATIPGQIGGGGEYTTQTGFGWSNGVVLEFLDLYGDQIEFTKVDASSTPEVCN